MLELSMTYQGKSLQWRRAENIPPDLFFLYFLRTSPRVRDVSFDQHPFSYNEHKVWVSNQLMQSRGGIYLVVVPELFGLRIGMGRLTAISESVARIAYSVSQEAEGVGIGSGIIEALEQQARLFGYAQIYATIKPTNTRSQKVLHRNGFTTQSEYRPDLGLEELCYTKLLRQEAACPNT